MGTKKNGIPHYHRPEKSKYAGRFLTVLDFDITSLFKVVLLEYSSVTFQSTSKTSNLARPIIGTTIQPGQSAIPKTSILGGGIGNGSRKAANRPTAGNTWALNEGNYQAGNSTRDLRHLDEGK